MSEGTQFINTSFELLNLNVFEVTTFNVYGCTHTRRDYLNKSIWSGVKFFCSAGWISKKYVYPNAENFCIGFSYVGDLNRCRYWLIDRKNHIVDSTNTDFGSMGGGKFFARKFNLSTNKNALRYSAENQEAREDIEGERIASKLSRVLGNFFIGFGLCLGAITAALGWGGMFLYGKHRTLGSLLSVLAAIFFAVSVWLVFG